jgi:tetratricopeptide (TPR) repeat protein
MGGFRVRPLLGRVTVALGEAYLGVGRLESARELLARGLQTAREKGFAGWGVRALGRLELIQGDHAGAERRLDEALRIFVEIGARFEGARTQLDLAEVARRRGDLLAGARRAAEARDTFQALGVAAYASRAARLSIQLGDPAASLRPTEAA